VGIFAVLGTILFAWVNIRDRMDPVIGRPDSVTAIEVLFYVEGMHMVCILFSSSHLLFSATLFVGILVWMGVLLVMAIPVAASKPYLLTRFLFVCIPTAFSVLSILVGIFSGTFGPVNSSCMFPLLTCSKQSIIFHEENMINCGLYLMSLLQLYLLFIL
jgi:hypothetical protein